MLGMFWMLGPWEILVILAVMALLLAPLLAALIVILVVVRLRRGRSGEGSGAKSPAGKQSESAAANPDRD
jgi:hypothetical protein